MILSVSWKYVACFAFLVYVVQLYIRRYVNWRKVEALGGETPRVTTRFFFGQYPLQVEPGHS
jgi:hypothetical protein